MMDLYREIILDEAKNPRNQGTIKQADAVISEFNASCGDKVEVYLKLDASKQKIADLKWTGVGCIISQAHMSVLSEHVKGLTLKQALALTREDVLQLLNLETITPGREKCLLISLNAVHKAVKLAKDQH